jgi:hypothetical protein
VVGFHVEDMGDGYVLRGVNKGAGSEAAGHWVLCSAMLEYPSPGMIRMKADYVGDAQLQRRMVSSSFI